MSNNEWHTQAKTGHVGEATKGKVYKETYKRTGDHKAAIRAYCTVGGNKWQIENAKAVGNWS